MSTNPHHHGRRATARHAIKGPRRAHASHALKGERHWMVPCLLILLAAAAAGVIASIYAAIGGC